MSSKAVEKKSRSVPLHDANMIRDNLQIFFTLMIYLELATLHALFRLDLATAAFEHLAH